MAITKILGIVNLTKDSFSDGGLYLDPDDALAHARRLLADGADVLDLGAESTHPDAEDVPAEEEIARLDPVVRTLKAEGARISVDTYKPTVIRHVARLGVDYINDITAYRNPEAIEAVENIDAKLILMHSRSAAARAKRRETAPDTLISEIQKFFEERIAMLTEAGIARERLILDPGMGFFLGSNPQASLTVLRHLQHLRDLGLPLLVSTSRKSFIGAILGEPDAPRPTSQRGIGTLTTEIWAVLQGAEYIRTHDVLALRDAIKILDELKPERTAL